MRTEHLPECTLDTQVNDWCICDRLRSCEARALREAREAVAALRNKFGDWIDQEQALAAIDALKGEQT